MLTGLQAYLGRGRRTRHGLLPAVAVVCLALLVFLAVVQVVHVHPNQSDADHCTLCIVMHTIAPAAVMAAVIVMVKIGISTPVAEERAVVRYWHPQLFTRPPPAGC